ncbi:MAG: YggS family pyridoxal phosphate-dependent enzyme, partial [Psychrobacter sp.]|nr:YggS family pyridoxal phosphate-dependent enzyme [Psychrobacter sp.]
MKNDENNIDSQSLINNWQQVSEQMTQACDKVERQTKDVVLLAVSKTKPAEMIAMLAQRGQAHFGENYLQEA